MAYSMSVSVDVTVDDICEVVEGMDSDDTVKVLRTISDNAPSDIVTYLGSSKRTAYLESVGVLYANAVDQSDEEHQDILIDILMDNVTDENITSFFNALQKRIATHNSEDFPSLEEQNKSKYIVNAGEACVPILTHGTKEQQYFLMDVLLDNAGKDKFKIFSDILKKKCDDLYV